MLPINTASNGRSSANTTTSISHKNETTTLLPEKHTTAAGAANSITTATATTNQSLKSNNNEGNNITKIPASATHRRDKSSVSGQQQIQHHHHQQHDYQHYPTQHKKDLRKYQYVKPQTLPIKPTATDAADELPNEQRTHHGHDNDEDDDDGEGHTLIYYDGNLISGSLQALIEHMVPTSDYYPEQTYIFSFLLSARLFIRPHELLAQISQTWERQQQQKAANTDEVDEAHFSHVNLNMTVSSASPLVQRKIANTTAEDVINEANKLQHSTTKKSAQNCIRLLSEWIETFPYDFRDERLMQQVRILARKCVYIDNSLGKQVSRILQLLVHRLTALERYEEFLQSLNAVDLNSSHHQHYGTSASASYTATSAAATATANAGGHNSVVGKSTVTTLNNLDTNKSILPTVLKTIPSANIQHLSIQSDSHSHDVYGLMDICPGCAQLAHQLTAIELERLSHIGPEEFVQAFAKEYQQSISNKSTESNVQRTSLNDMKKTRNLESYVEWFNRLSYLTASEIVKYPKKKQRVRIIEFWIETARECFNIGNFNSLMAIIAGLNLAPIARLKKTWSKVQSAKFSVLEHQMDPTSNFISYRSTLKAAMWRSEGATDERERIIIPFFSLFVKDLYFLNEGCSNRLANNHINFEKCTQLAKQVMEFTEWKKVTCPFEKLPNVIAYLQNSPVLNENTLSMASFECEPPENTEEKGRYKTVKAETKQQLLQQLQEQQQHQHQHQQQ